MNGPREISDFVRLSFSNFFNFCANLTISAHSGSPFGFFPFFLLTKKCFFYILEVQILESIDNLPQHVKAVMGTHTHSLVVLQ